MGYIAHIRASDQQQQTVEEHLLGVRALAESFGAKLGVSHIAGLAGMLHDMGKYTEAFRNYLLEAVANPDAPPRRGSVDHSTAGGKLLYNLYHQGKIERYKGLLAEIVGNAIISHHAYLQDFLNPELQSSYLRRVRDTELEEFEHAEKCFFEQVITRQELDAYVQRAAAELEAYMAKDPGSSSEKKLMFLSKFIFSALIDADRTNTRQFEENTADEAPLQQAKLFSVYYDRLMDKVNALQKDGHDTPINRLRQEMSAQCDRFAEQPSGIYTLSIPTGGGKTLASLRYALKHAVTYGKKRIIYVVPYTTIIEQNAAEVRRIIQDDARLLEHHSNVVEDHDMNDEQEDGLINVRQKLRLAKDNWDSPVIFTTMVQFLNVFYAKGSRNIRRLHNLCESVLIFDEVQKVPVSCVSLFNEALNFLSVYGNSSLLLCTATQPALDYVEHKLHLPSKAEIIEDLPNVVDAFKRVEIVDQAADQTFNNRQLCDFILDRFEEVNSVLVILNTKTVVKQLYQMVKEAGSDIPVYHLSTSMCPAHRKDLLDEIRDHLIQGNKILCISTQLIEAGVDVSFECVIRSLAGLDSIAQAAGRCNRHGEQELRQVYVIDHAEENLKHLKEIKRGKEIAKKILLDLKRETASHGGHLLSVQAMERYFKEFYTAFNSDLDYFVPKLHKNLIELLSGSKADEDSYFQAYYSKHQSPIPLFLTNSYKTAAEHFQVIDSQTTTVLVPYGAKGRELIAELNGEKGIRELSMLLKGSQQYSIPLFNHELSQLDANGGLESCLDGRVLVLKEGAYSKEFGLDLENDSGFDLSIC